MAWTVAKEDGKLDTTELHALELPVEATGQGAMVSMAGVASTLPVVDGKISVKLDGGPQYITVRAGK